MSQFVLSSWFIRFPVFFILFDTAQKYCDRRPTKSFGGLRMQLISTKVATTTSNWDRRGGIVGFAGSRHGSVSQQVCDDLVSLFAGIGSRFLVGCAPGVDQRFRRSLAASSAASRCTVHCAFPSGLRTVMKEGLHGVCLVSDKASAATALHQRTVTMVSQCSFMVYFPTIPKPAHGAKDHASHSTPPCSSTNRHS